MTRVAWPSTRQSRQRAITVAAAAVSVSQISCQCGHASNASGDVEASSARQTTGGSTRDHQNRLHATSAHCIGIECHQARARAAEARRSRSPTTRPVAGRSSGAHSVDATDTAGSSEFQSEWPNTRLATPAASCSAIPEPTSAPARRRVPIHAAARPMRGHTRAASAGAIWNSRLALATPRPTTRPTLLAIGTGRGVPAVASRHASRRPSQPVASSATPISSAATRFCMAWPGAGASPVICSDTVIAVRAPRCSSTPATRRVGAASRPQAAAQAYPIQAVIAPAHSIGHSIQASAAKAKAAAKGTAVATICSTPPHWACAIRRRTRSTAHSATASMAMPSAEPAISGTSPRKSSERPSTRRRAAPSTTTSANARA